MPDYSKLSDEELVSLYQQQNAAQQPQAPQTTDFSKMSDEQLMQMYKQQAAFTENTGNLAVPIEGAPLPKNAPSAPESSTHPLNADWITPEFVRDFRALTGVDPQRLAIEEENRLVTSTKEALNAAVSGGLIKPDFQNPDPSTFQAFQSQWDAYKSDMDASAMGAMYRGAKSNIGATAGATLAAAAASPTGLLGMIPAGMAGGAIGAGAQEMMFPTTTEDRAQQAFDQQRALTRNARLAGEIVPSLATMKPSVSMLKGAIARSPEAIKQLGITVGLAAGIPAGIDLLKGNSIDPERIAWSLGSGVLLAPNKYGTFLFDKFARTENAARNIRNRIYDVTVQDKSKALQQLGDYASVAQFGVKPLSGEVVGSEDLIAFQQAMRNQNTAIRQRAVDNEAAIAKAIEANLPEPATATPQSTRAYIEHQHDVIDATAIATRDAMLLKGEQDAAQILSNAHAQSQSINQLRDQGIITAEAAHALANERYVQASEAIDSLRGTSRAPSLRSNTLLEASKAAVKQVASDLFDSLPLGAQTDFENTYKAAKKAATEYSKLKNVHPTIQKIIKLRAPVLNKKGQLVRKTEKIKNLLRDLEAVTEDIAIASEEGRTNDARILKGVKDGIEKDFDAVGNMWEEVAKARDFYRDMYAKPYLHGTLGAMLSAAPNADPDIRLGKILFSTNSGTKGITSPEQLRLALKGNGSAVDMVTEFMTNELAQKGGRTSASLQKWYESDEVQRIMQAFPEARADLQKYITEMQDFEAISRRTKTAEDKARGVKDVKPDPVEIARAKMVTETAAIKAKDAYNQQQQVKQSEAFQAFYKRNEINAIEHMLKSGDPAQTADEILNIVRQDPTGDALLGYQNAVKMAFKKMIRKTGRELGSNNDVNEPLQGDELGISLSKANSALVEGSVWRRVLETVLPPDELKALDTVRRQLAITERPARASGGQSPTAPQGAFSQELRAEMDKNVIGFLSRVARGNRTDTVISTKASRLADFLQSIYFGQPGIAGSEKGFKVGARALAEEYAGWSGKSLGERAKEMLSETLLDPNLAIEALSSSPTSVRGREMLRAWFVNRDHLLQDGPNVLPFNQLNTTETQLPNGKWMKDRSTGYYIENKGSKFKVLNYKNDRVGIYDSLEEARNAAVKDYQKPVANIKVRRD